MVGNPFWLGCVIILKVSRSVSRNASVEYCAYDDDKFWTEARELRHNRGSNVTGDECDGEFYL